MSLNVAVGTSVERNPTLAAQSAVAMARQQRNIDRPDLVILFAGVGYDQRAAVRAVRAATGEAPLVGCSTEGIISRDGSVEEPYSMLVALFKSDRHRFSVASAVGMKDDAEKVGQGIGAALKPSVASDSLVTLLFPDGLTLNYDRLTAGLARGAGPECQLPPLMGGAAGDNWQFKKTYQYANDDVFSDGASALLISGEGKLVTSVNHGCVPIGAERKVTKSHENRIYEIDGRSALDVLREYVEIDEQQDWAKVLVHLAIGFKAPGFMQDRDEHIIRYIPQKNDEEGWITINTAVPEGSSIWMTRRDYDKISTSLDRSAREIRDGVGEREVDVVFQFDCAGRGKVIFRDNEKQQLLDKTRKLIGVDVPWLGFHSYGELGPVSAVNCFHSFTAVFGALVRG
ncbi:MAG TPA: FIST N-terminal domain-containing protein [Labilithrix sp.]|nr:FIST N-terminal domain-containing protein [Labilithrix sp.]